jgi:thioesterase domain-containing protein
MHGTLPQSIKPSFPGRTGRHRRKRDAFAIGFPLARVPGTPVTAPGARRPFPGRRCVPPRRHEPTRIQRMQSPAGWLSVPGEEPFQPAGGDGATATVQPAADTPLFLIHDETCAAEDVSSLAGHLSGAAAVVALSGCDGAERGLRTVEGMALCLAQRILAAQPAGPYRIAGWSRGGILAYEVAALLLGRDAPVEFLGVIQLPGRAPDAPSEGSHESALLRAVRRYVPPSLPVTVHLFTADAADDAGPWRAWGAAVPRAATRTVPVPTGAAPLEALAEALDGEMRRASEPAAVEPEAGLSTVFPLRFRGSRTPVYCIPGAGASVVGLAELAACLEPGCPVYGLEPRGMDAASVPHTTVAAAADYYLARIEETTGAGPIHLVGHSFGGWVALEMALRLLSAGRPVASLGVIDSSVPDPDASIIDEYDGEEAFLSLVEVLELAAERSFEIGAAQIRALDEDARLRLLHGRMVRFGLVPSRSAPAMMAGPFRVFAACLRATYRPSAVYPLPARLVLLRDSRLDLQADQLRVAEIARGWKDWLADVQVSVGPGNHMTALKRPHVEQLASLLPLGA